MPSRSDAFRAALVAASELLLTLPRERAQVQAARERVSRFAGAHPVVRVDLAVDLKPGSSDADYDILIGHPNGGTVAVTYRPDNGNPWLVDYSEHWAANFVLTVGADAPITAQQALTALEVRAGESPGLIDSLIDDAIVERAMDIDPPVVRPDELQAAVDAFRAARGLHSSASTHAWLSGLGLSVELFQTLIENGVRFRKMSERLTTGQIEPYFEEHRADFDVVRYFRVETRSAGTARRLAQLGEQHGLLSAAERASGELMAGAVNGTFTTARAHELPPELAEADPLKVVGPIASKGKLWLAEILGRNGSTLDGATRIAVRDVLFRQWLDEQRSQRQVRWHWL
jgi:putative peptide maturation system protein